MAAMEAALPRTMARDIRSVSHAVSRLLPVQAETCRPSFWMKDLVEGPNTPVTSTATGSNMYLSVKQEYFVLLSSSAAAAADPGAMAELKKLDFIFRVFGQTFFLNCVFFTRNSIN